MNVRLLATAALAAAVAWSAPAVAVTPLASTRMDFNAPGTQPLSLTDLISTPDTCSPCHSGYGQPQVEPVHNWKGSMMAQSGRDPLMWAALAVSNQDAPHSGETCLRCHLPKGWLEGRSVPEDGSAMTADDRQGVQCGVCHRLVDPISRPGNPAADGPILAALTTPVTFFSNAMMVIDPLDRLRGPFDIVADLGLDPHAPQRSTLVSPFHETADLCGTCHGLRNPLFTKNMTGDYDLNAMDTPTSDLAHGFPEQTTYDEWAASTYATTGVLAPQFGGDNGVVTNCQSCHMPDVGGKDANLGLTRADIPRHSFAGSNTFIPSVLPSHPAFGSEVDPAALQDGIARSTDMLRRAATVSATLSGGTLTVRVTNDTGHKLPTGYPEGRRMWLHVRAWDADRHVVFESGRYVTASATLDGYGAQPLDPDYDPYLHVWETRMGMSAAVATQVGLTAGQSFHLSLNNVRLKDNRIPPRGFTNAAYDAFDAAPVGASYPDGQYWDDVVYPAGASAAQADVTLYYQTTSREYVEFLRDEGMTAAGPILYDLWNQGNKSAPVAMAQVFVEPDVRVVSTCKRKIAALQARYQKRHYQEWARCYAGKASGLSCDGATRDARIVQEAMKLTDGIGGARDATCAGKSLTPSTLGHGSACPVPCAQIALFDMSDLGTCTICLAEALDDQALQSAYGVTPPTLPAMTAGAQSCQRALDKAAGTLAGKWTKALARCEQDNASGANMPPVDCSTDPDGRVAAAKAAAGRRIHSCSDYTGIAGCGAQVTPSSVQACLETAVGSVVEDFTQGAYP